MFQEYLEELPIISVIRKIKPENLVPLVKATYDTGVRILEVTLNTDDAFQQISKLRSEFGEKMAIGAGTVLTRVQAEGAVDAGATFLVSPNCSSEISSYCRSVGVPYIPGALTPSEIYDAWQQSNFAVKVFPASLFGPGYIKSLVGGPYNQS